jgi:hypothetical protein
MVYQEVDHGPHMIESSPLHSMLRNRNAMSHMNSVRSLACVLISTSAMANIPPDYYGETPTKSTSFWRDKGQIIGTNGQSVPDVDFYSEGGFPRMFMRKNSEMSFVLASVDTIVGTMDTLRRLDMRFIGEVVQMRDPVVYEARDHHKNYYLAHTGMLGATQVDGWARVVYENVWPNIDVHFYGTRSGQKIAIVIKPGALPQNVQLEFEGQDSLGIDVLGALKLWSGGKWIRLEEAVAYQYDNNNTVLPVGWNAAYTANNGTGHVGFNFDTYDPTLPLVLQIGHAPLGGGGPYEEPGLCLNTYLGGDDRDVVLESSLDEAGVYQVTGRTGSSHLVFPNSTGVDYTADLSGTIAFATRFDSDDDISFTTFMGGNVLDGSNTQGRGIGTKGSGSSVHVYFAGGTNATDLAVDPEGTAYYDDDNSSGLFKGFICKLDFNGIREWCTYFWIGGTIEGLCVRDNKHVYVTGSAEALGMPVQQDTHPDSDYFGYGGSFGDAFIAWFNDNDRLNWRTWYGAEGFDVGTDIRCTDDKIVVMGRTNGYGLPLLDGGPNALDADWYGSDDVFIAEFSPVGEHRWGTYFGSSGQEWAADNGLAVDPVNGDIAITGWTFGTDLQLVYAGSQWYDAVATAQNNGYIALFDGNTRARKWVTYFGNTEITLPECVVFDDLHNLYAAGYTNDPGNPVWEQPGLYYRSTIYADGPPTYVQDAFIYCWTPDQWFAWGTFFGGNSGPLGENIKTMVWKPSKLYASGLVAKSNPLSYWPLHDPMNGAYFEEVYADVSPLTSDAFVAQFCTDVLTGIGDQDASNSIDCDLIALGGNQFVLVVSSASDQARPIVLDAAGRTVLVPLRRIGSTGYHLDMDQLADGGYVIALPGLVSVKAIVIH